MVPTLLQHYSWSPVTHVAFPPALKVRLSPVCEVPCRLPLQVPCAECLCRRALPNCKYHRSASPKAEKQNRDCSVYCSLLHASANSDCGPFYQAAARLLVTAAQTGRASPWVVDRARAGRQTAARTGIRNGFSAAGIWCGRLASADPRLTRKATAGLTAATLLLSDD